MVNVHQVCRLCMADIGVQGIDCSAIEPMRNAIEALYKLEIKADDECSKRVCPKCVALVVDFTMHSQTVKDTQEKIKQCIDLQKQINSNSVLIKEEVLGTAAANAEQPVEENGDASASESNGTNQSQQADAVQADADRAERVPEIIAIAENVDGHSRATNTDESMSRSRTGSVSTNKSQKRAKSTDTSTSRSLAGSSNASETRSRVASADTGEAQNRDKNADTSRKSQSRTGSASTGEAQNRDKNADRSKSQSRTESASTVGAQNRNKKADASKLRGRAPSTISGDAPASSSSTKTEAISVRNASEAEKKRHRSTLHERNDSADDPATKRSKASRHSPRSSVSSVDVSNLVNESPPATASQNQRSKTIVSTAKSSANTPKKSRNRRSNEPVASTSGQETILKYLSKLSCKKCNAVLKTLPESKFHDKCHASKQCPLCKKAIRSAQISNHVQTCLLISKELSTDELLKYMNPLSIKMIRVESTTNHQPVPSIKKERGSVATAQNGNRRANNENSDSEVIRPAKRINCSRPIIIDSSSEEETRDTDAASARATKTVNVGGNANTAAETVAEMPSQKKKVARRESTVQRQEKCALQFGKNTSLPASWNRAANNNRVFYTQAPYPKLSNQYMTIESTVMADKLAQLDNIRLKMAATTRKVPNNSDRETTAPEFGANESPRNQPSQVKPIDRRKSIHSISSIHSIGTAVYRQNGENGPSTIEIPLVPRLPTLLPKPIAQPNGQCSPVVLQPPVSVPYQRQNVFYTTNHINGGIVPTTSAAALGATTSPSPSATSSTASAPSQTLSMYSSQPSSNTNAPSKNAVKVLSVNELNSRAIQINNNDNKPTQNQISHVNGLKMKFVPIQPKPTKQPNVSSQSENHTQNQNQNDTNDSNPIHVTLIKRSANELELQLTRNGQRISFESLSESQRIEVQKSLLANNVWEQMLNHVKVGKPSPHTLELFKRLLPATERKRFFDVLAAYNRNNNSMS